MSENIIKVTIDGKNYNFTGTIECFVIEENYVDCEVSGVKVTEDGIEKKTFGESFVGHKYDANDFLDAVIAAYMNCDTAVCINDVCKKLEKAFDAFNDIIEIEGRKIQRKIMTPSLGIADLNIVVEKDKKLTKVYSRDEMLIYVNDAGTVMSDIEAFVNSGIVSDINDGGKIVFASDEIIKNYYESLAKEA